TSEYLMCLSSGLGCTVMPSAPNCWQSMAAFITSGLLPPLLFLRVAILFILTESFVDIVPVFFKIKQYIFYIAVTTMPGHNSYILFNKFLLVICCFLLPACSDKSIQNSGNIFRYNISN